VNEHVLALRSPAGYLKADGTTYRNRDTFPNALDIDRPG
jgi:hypothetical protein